jgi:hypothetical protein
MKGKLSASVDEALIEFLDSLPGKTRSEKLELVLTRYKQLEEVRLLRHQLSEFNQDGAQDDEWEREAWEHTASVAMWSE